ncbi:DUF1778 domain-containing protein [Aeromonas veronii]
MTNLSILSVNQGDLPRNSRIELKTNSDIKDVLRHAATSCGVDLTSFILQAAAEKARQILLESQVLFLSSSMFDKVNDSINNPPAPSASLLTLLAEDTFGDVEESKPRVKRK